MDDLFRPARIPSRYIEAGPNTKIECSTDPATQGMRIKLDGGELIFFEDFFSKKLSDRMVAYLQENEDIDWTKADWARIAAEQLEKIEFTNIKWKQDRIKFFGKTHPLPRLTSWYGDPGASYSYSGIQSDPNPWNEGLLFVKSKIEQVTGIFFNSVLLNWYRDGSDSLNWHADDEKELGPEPTIASANFGATRDFLLRRKDDKESRLSIQLRHGSLLVMKGKTQQNWVHSIPKRKGKLGPRFNLTFRQIHRI